jgi:hypothetical protein
MQGLNRPQGAVLGAGAIAVIALIVALARGAQPQGTPRTVHVSGSGVDRADGAIVHSEQQGASGLVRTATEIVELEGDLHGRVLYQVTTRIDAERHKLTNTGRQVYSGTVAGSGPVLLYDDQFVFNVDLTTGAEHGAVYLVHQLGGPAVRCELAVQGGGRDAGGNPAFTYSGECRFAR